MRVAVSQILKRNQLSVTGSRKKILGLFLENEGALAHADIEKKAGEKFDRVTLYRTLQVFVEKGILHSIPSADNSIRYALCKEDCEQGHHQDNHIHFICKICSKAICMDGVSVPQVTLPHGFTPTHYDMVVTGVCKNCKN